MHYWWMGSLGWSRVSDVPPSLLFRVFDPINPFIKAYPCSPGALHITEHPPVFSMSLEVVADSGESLCPPAPPTTFLVPLPLPLWLHNSSPPLPYMSQPTPYHLEAAHQLQLWWWFVLPLPSSFGRFFWLFTPLLLYTLIQ